MVASEEFKFIETYAWAERVHGLLHDEDPDWDIADLLEIKEARFQELIANPCRWTLLHELISATMDIDMDYWAGKDEESFVQKVPDTLKAYGVRLPRRTKADDDGTYAYKLMAQFQKAVQPRIVQETFTVLYGDRGFLLKLNSVIASFVRDMKVADVPVLEKDGVVKRCYLPTWLKAGVFFRDRGRCAKCAANLSGADFLGETIHHDHMVPLADGGTNDPINFQILCEDDNLKKGIGVFTSLRYQPYWIVQEG